MIYDKPSPFETGKPVNPKNFQGRVKLIEKFKLFINQASYGNPEHFFINGKRGMGKSSFADLLLSIAKNEFNMIGIHVYNDGISNLDDLINNIVEEILNQIISTSWSDKIFDSLKDSIESVGFLGTTIKFKPNEKSITENIRDKFAYFLIDLIKSSKNTNGIFIVIDDINGLSKTPDFVNWYKKFSEILASKFRDESPIVFMLTSFPEKIHELYNQNPSFNRIFRHDEIKALQDSEVRNFFIRMFGEIDMKIKDDALDIMIHFSSGIPTMMQEIGDAIYWICEDNIISKKTALLGIIRAGQEIGVKYLKPTLDSSIRSKNYLSIFNKLGQDFLNHQYEDYLFIKKDFINNLDETEKKVFNDFLRRSRQLGIIEFAGAKNSGKYKFTNNLYPLYFAILSLNN